MENYNTENIKIELEDNERVYRVRETVKDSYGAPYNTSSNFKIKNDTIHFFLTKKRKISIGQYKTPHCWQQNCLRPDTIPLSIHILSNSLNSSL